MNGDSGVQVTDRGSPRTPLALILDVVRAVRDHTGRPDLSVSLLLTDDAEIARLHGEYLDDPTPTDVMSFDLDGTAELVVSVETAAREAARGGHEVHGEVALYIAHGLLHLCGFDDHDDDDRRAMRAAERAVLEGRLGLRVRRVDGEDDDEDQR